jgi:hypothetical protein
MQLRALPLHARSGTHLRQCSIDVVKGKREGQGERQDHV